MQFLIAFGSFLQIFILPVQRILEIFQIFEILLYLTTV